MSEQIFRDSDADRSFRPSWRLSRLAVYLVLVLWAFVCLFPIYWTLTTSFKAAPNVMQGNLIPWVDFEPQWLGLRSLGLSPETIFAESTVRAEFMKRFWNSTIVSLSASTLAVLLGSCAAYGLSPWCLSLADAPRARIAVVGLGRAGLPAARRLAAWGAEVTAWDDQAPIDDQGWQLVERTVVRDDSSTSSRAVAH